MEHEDRLGQRLNQEQQAAVLHDDGPLLVVAGAGTGKTAVITRRIARLISEHKAQPNEILALTFTEKAAREMADRLYDLVGWESFQVPILTFNAFGAELLGRFASHVGRSIRGGLLNSTQKVLLLRQHFDEITLEYYNSPADVYDFLEPIVGYIERLQNNGVTADRYVQFVQDLSKQPGEWSKADILEQQDLAKLYKLYDQVKQKTGTYDYNDQLAVPLEILHRRPNLADRLASEYRYVLVDEYQDTSKIQDALLRSFVPANGNIFVVGDDDQAIYGFRGADITNILSFAEHFKVDQPRALIQNYRSGQPILDAAYRMIQNNNPERLESKLALSKRLVAQSNEAEVRFNSYNDVDEEQTGNVDLISSWIKGGTNPSEIALLARSNGVLKSYAKALRMRSIPFALSTEVNIFEQRELINLWYLLAWLGNTAPEEGIAHVILGPFVGWKPEEYRQIIQRAKNDLSSPEDILREVAAQGHQEAKELVANLDTWRDWAAHMPVSQLAYRLVFETGLSDRLISRAENDSRIIRVFEDLHMLLGQMQDYEAVTLDNTLPGYLATFPRPPMLESPEALGDPSGVQLLTVHASKGLEFDTVLLVGCTQKSWSLRAAMSLEVPSELLEDAEELGSLHEQRRLMYVAATRAKRRLFLSASTNSPGGQKQTLSPLVGELLGSTPRLNSAQNENSDVDKLMQRLQRYYPLKEYMRTDRLPIEDENGWINLSVSAIDQYARCPYEFYLQYVLRISSPFGPQLSFGTALHSAIQAYYEAKLRGESPSLEQLAGRLDEAWNSQGYETRSLADAAYTKAIEALKWFMSREDSEAARRILYSERKFTLELSEAKLRLHGRIDACFNTDEGVEVRDFKTGQKWDPDKLAKDAKNSLQLRTYALAYESMTGQPPATVTLDYIVTGAQGSAHLTEKILQNHRAKLAEYASRIRERDFAPAPESQFHKCSAFKYYGDMDTDMDS